MRASGTAARAGRQADHLRARNDVAGHSRVRRTGSIGVRLLLPVAAASLGLVVGGVVIVSASTTDADQARRARVMADATAAVVRLVDNIEQEVAESNALRERGGKAGAQLLEAQRARTDRALAGYLRASEAALAEAPSIRRPVGHVSRLLDPFAKARSAALDSSPEVIGFGDAFEQITHHLLDLASAIAEQISDQRLGNLARSAAGMSELKHLAAEQRDLLRGAFVKRKLTQGELVTLAELYGDEQARLSEVTHIATETTRQRFTEVYAGPDVESAAALRDAVLTSGGAAGSLAVDADAWYIAQSGAMRLLRIVELELVDRLATAAARNQADAQTRAALIAAIALLVVLGTLGAGAVLAVRTARRLRRLRAVALTVARGELPAAVAQVASASDSEAVREAMGGSHRRVGAMLDAGRDEVAEVSSAIGVVHQQALRLAAEQALLRLEVSALFVALSRRGQSLVLRQLELLDEFEHAGTDQETLTRLVALDHLAARMRRNEENLLVLSGGEPGRRVDGPVALTDVVGAAIGEIEDYDRVEPPADDDVWIAARAVNDVVHLLAELFDNATSFSPPHTRVRVYAERDGTGVALSIVDSGIGMTDEQLAEANRRLSRPGGLTATLVGTMGLLVVARLAARRGIVVYLRRSADGGTAAEVRLPQDILAAAPPRHPPAALRPAPKLSLSLPPAVTAAVVPAGPPVSPPPAGSSTVPVPAWSSGMPEPAVPGMPGPAVPGMPGPAVPGMPGPAAPGIPDPLARPAPAGAPTTLVTATGLPLRQPSAPFGWVEAADPPGQSRRGSLGAPRASKRSDADDVFLDPETVRTRLSSLAGGIAAARRREAPPGASHME